MIHFAQRLEGTEFATDENLFIAFAKFEEQQKEFDRARVIFKYALDVVPKGQAQALYRMYTAFEKQHGSKEGIDNVIASKRRFEYEEEIKKNALNYDVWFDYIRLEQSYGDANTVREVFERAIANIPPSTNKNRWRRYIYLWINYALYEELDAKDVDRTRAVFNECLRIIPHKKFSFAKIWTMFANFEIRQHNLDQARKVFGNAIGRAPKKQIFMAYIDLEYQLSNIDRCRKLYEQWIAHDPANCDAWMQYAQMEQSLEEIERARALYELAVVQPLLDMPEVVWKAFIDLEITNEEYDRVRNLYDRLLQRTKHVKVRTVRIIIIIIIFIIIVVVLFSLFFFFLFFFSP
jgi:crooked neck